MRQNIINKKIVKKWIEKRIKSRYYNVVQIDSVKIAD